MFGRFLETVEPENDSMYTHNRLRLRYLQHIPSRGQTCRFSFHSKTSCLLGFLQIAVGTKSGEILIYDLASSALTETVKAHSSTVWSLHVRPDEQVLVSGSADKEVKFWEFERNVSSNDEVSVSLFEYALCDLNHELTYADQKVNDNKSHTNVEDVG